MNEGGCSSEHSLLDDVAEGLGESNVSSTVLAKDKGGAVKNVAKTDDRETARFFLWKQYACLLRTVLSKWNKALHLNLKIWSFL